MDGGGAQKQNAVHKSALINYVDHSLKIYYLIRRQRLHYCERCDICKKLGHYVDLGSSGPSTLP